MRNALEFGDAALIAKLGILLSEGASMLCSLTKDEPMDGKDRSSKMSALIDEGEFEAHVWRMRHPEC